MASATRVGIGITSTVGTLGMARTDMSAPFLTTLNISRRHIMSFVAETNITVQTSVSPKNSSEVYQQ